MKDASELYDAVVIGGGPAGLTAAIALTEAGAKTALLARRAPYGDNRTTALLGASVDLLERLDVWPRCRDNAALKLYRVSEGGHQLPSFAHLDNQTNKLFGPRNHDIETADEFWTFAKTIDALRVRKR